MSKLKYIHIKSKAVAMWLLILLIGCQSTQKKHKQTTKSVITTSQEKMDSMNCCSSKLPSRFSSISNQQEKRLHEKQKMANRSDMVLIRGGTYIMGGDSIWGRADEFPHHLVKVSSFYMDKHEVTNAQFRAFVDATGYVTTAERKPNWEEIKKQLPFGTPKPPDSVLVAASLVFTPPHHPVSLNNAYVWWSWMPGADWRHPEGPTTSIKGKDNYPVVQVSWKDANAYADWAGKRLPTEAEWEYAARGGNENTIYPWGNERIDKGKLKANTWQGHFPNENTGKDQYFRAAPVMSFPPNGYGLYDMAGNVWEWCHDWYQADYYSTCAAEGTVSDPQGPDTSLDPDEPNVPKRVTRGGSFLCTDQYCSGFRVSARMKTSWDTSLEHTGFRCVVSK